MNLATAQTIILLIDFQGDFTQYRNGPLAAMNTDTAYISNVRRATSAFKHAGYSIIATQDWHPANHLSFYTNHPNKRPFDTLTLQQREQILWPPHAVQHTPGAELLIEQEYFSDIIRKGTDPLYDSYSAFYDDGAKPTVLDEILQNAGILHLVIYGLATDYCVLATVTDAHRLGYTIWLIPDLCRGVALNTTQQALTKMQDLGVNFIKPPIPSLAL